MTYAAPRRRATRSSTRLHEKERRVRSTGIASRLVLASSAAILSGAGLGVAGCDEARGPTSSWPSSPSIGQLALAIGLGDAVSADEHEHDDPPPGGEHEHEDP